MTLHANCLRRTTAVAAFLLLARTVAGQDGAIHLDVQPVPHLPNRSGLAYEVFGPLDSLTVEIVLENADPVRTLVLEPGFFEAITWRLDYVTPVDQAAGRAVLEVLTADVLENIACGPSSNAACNLTSRNFIPSESWIKLRVRLRKVSARFETGAYRVVRDATAAHKELREMDFSPWKGRFLDRGSMPLSIIPVRTRSDELKRYELQAWDETKHGNFSRALEAYRRMASVDPADVTAQLGIGRTLILLGSFREAAVVLEPVWLKYRSRDAADRLVVAYIALGREAEAQALASQVYPPQRIAQFMEQSRAMAKNLMSRRP
jgi:tetratricopeptide repeat protein